MSWKQLATFLSILAMCNTMNRPVLKIVLNQKGYAQFVQYDVEIPPLREFTLCVWVRLSDLAGDQSIFTYVGRGSTRLIRVWLDSGGRQIKISINEKVTSSAAVEFGAEVWQHVCLSYQSDYGAWALYLDSRLVLCAASQNLLGYVVPGGGSLIIGYGTSEKGAPNGLTGEIYGVSMLLFSTIERNHTLKRDPEYEQKPFRKNQIKNKNKQDNKYIVLGDLQTDEIRDYLHETSIPLTFTKPQNYIHFSTPQTFIEHDVGIGLTSANQNQGSTSGEKEIADFAITDSVKLNDNRGVWNSLPLGNKKHLEPKEEFSKSNTQDLPATFAYETPPAANAFKVDYSVKSSDVQPSTNNVIQNKKIHSKHHIDSVSVVEKPPPPEDKPKVYGQWTSSKFVGNVLKYLKSINFNKNREPKKVPLTIPLIKITDSFPYQSEFKLSKLQSPQKFTRRHFVPQHHDIKKRDVRQPQINLQIVESDMRGDILKSHSETQPKLVEVTNRGEAKQISDKRHYRNANSYTESLESVEASVTTGDKLKEKPFSGTSHLLKNNQKILPNHRGGDLMTILPFLKSIEYFIDNNEDNNTKINEKNAMYSKTFVNANKWHNVKSYSNDYTPRRINLESQEKGDLNNAQVYSKNYPTIKLKYKHEDKKLIHVNNHEETIVKGRVLAEEVSSQANENRDSISILKYNHGFLPGHAKKTKISDKVRGSMKDKDNKSNFNKHVKLGNALNERHIIGFNEEQRKQSFEGGDDKIPDIHKYRSDGDNEHRNIPSSLGPRVCKNLELYDRVLYVQPDGRIDMSHIISPVREKNLGVEFIVNNYKKCSMRDSIFEDSFHLLIDWNKTPVRLFGGAFPKKTRDLCGFF